MIDPEKTGPETTDDYLSLLPDHVRLVRMAGTWDCEGDEGVVMGYTTVSEAIAAYLELLDETYRDDGDSEY